MNPNASAGRERLRAIARRAMTERGLVPDFSPAVLAQTEALGERGGGEVGLKAALGHRPPGDGPQLLASGRRIRAQRAIMTRLAGPQRPRRPIS